MAIRYVVARRAIKFLWKNTGAKGCSKNLHFICWTNIMLNRRISIFLSCVSIFESGTITTAVEEIKQVKPTKAL